MIETDDVVAITQNVFSTMIQMDAYPISMDACGEPEMEMVGCIQIVGEWCGTVLLKTSVALASTAGSRMFGIDENDVADASASRSGGDGGGGGGGWVDTSLGDVDDGLG